MKLTEIIEIASSGYPGGCVALAYEEQTPVGDGLAEFVANELIETFEEGKPDLEQLNRAAEVIEKARRDLGEVLSALNYATALKEVEVDEKGE